MIAGSNTCSNRSRSRLLLEIEHIFEPARGQSGLTSRRSSISIDVVSNCLPNRLGLKMTETTYPPNRPLGIADAYDEALMELHCSAQIIADNYLQLDGVPDSYGAPTPRSIARYRAETVAFAAIRLRYLGY